MKTKHLFLFYIFAIPLFGQHDSDESFYKSEIKNKFASKIKKEVFVKVDNNFDVKYYKLDLKITSSPNYISGSVTTIATSNIDNLNKMAFDLASNLTIDSILVSGVKSNFVRTGSSFEITLPNFVNKNNSVLIETYYRGTPLSGGFGSFVFSQHNNIPWVYTLSEPYGAKDWWPCKDHPSDKADSADIIITCDSSFLVGSNGILKSVKNNLNGTKTFNWKENYPIANYLIAVSLTNYSSFSNYFKYNSTDSMEVLNYILPENLSQAKTSLPPVVDMLKIFSDLFGLYPFIKEKYGHVQFGWGGAMEHQTMTSITGFGENTLAHELAHHWFGDMITCETWSNIWLNEGFATYCEALYREKKYGSASYWQHMNSKMNSAKNAVGTVFVYDTSSVSKLFSGSLVYSKGGTVLHMLRHILGDSVFFKSIFNYANDPSLKHSTATTEEFQKVCETTSGKNLDYFFKEWIYGEKYPNYFFSWNSTSNSSGYTIDLKISQTTGTLNPQFFTMPVDIKINSTNWDTTVTIFNNQQTQNFLINVSRIPVSVEIDPQGWILKNATKLTVQDLLFTPNKFQLNQNYPNPFNNSTVINFYISTGGFVNLKIYNLLGKEVSTLINKKISSGMHSINFNGDGLPSGVYFYKIIAPNYSETKKMVLSK